MLLVGLIAAVPARPPARPTDRRQRLQRFGSVLLYVAALVAPWRVWTAAHHLSDAVTPPLPRALSPVYLISRGHELHDTVTALLTQTLSQWGWLAAIFITACIVCIITRTGRRVAWFYVSAFGAIVASLLWLYTTTSVSLAFLLPTSMGRTVGWFMLLAGFATAHLLYLLLADARPGPA